MRIKSIILIMGILLTGCSRQTTDSKVTFGTLPVIQALPIFVANDLNLFTKHGIEVELISFNSALESEIAISAGQIDGYFADIITPMILKANNTELQIVSTLFKTDNRQRMFALLTPPGVTNISAEELSEKGIAVSTNTVIDYITPYLLQSVDSTVIKYNKIDTKKIPIRLQLLLQNQVPAAVLPEPLVTFAEQKGAYVFADDSALNMAPIVAAFRTKCLAENSDGVKRFLSAIKDAIQIINNKPDDVQEIMFRNCRIPELLHSFYPVPKFPELSVPSIDNIYNAYQWLSNQQIIAKSFDINVLTTDEYLP